MGNLKSWPQWQAVYSRARDAMQIFKKPVKGTTWNSSAVELGKTCCCLTKCTQIPSLSCSLKIKVTSSKAYFKMLFVRINTTKQQQKKQTPQNIARSAKEIILKEYSVMSVFPQEGPLALLWWEWRTFYKHISIKRKVFKLEMPIWLTLPLCSLCTPSADNREDSSC